jgi:hypothetical protein
LLREHLAEESDWPGDYVAPSEARKLATSNEMEELVRGHGHHCLAGHLPNYDYVTTYKCFIKKESGTQQVDYDVTHRKRYPREGCDDENTSSLESKSVPEIRFQQFGLSVSRSEQSSLTPLTHNPLLFLIHSVPARWELLKAQKPNS